MDGDPPVETSGAANREARQHGSEEAGNEAWLVSEEAARQQHGPPLGCSISTTRGRPPSQQGQPARSGLAHPPRIRRRNGWWDGIVGSGSVAGCLVAAPERGCQGVLFGGEYDDRGRGVLDDWRARGRIGPPLAHHRQHNTNHNRTTQMPHLGDRPTQPHHASSPPVTRPQHGAQGRSSGQGFEEQCLPIGNKRARVTTLPNRTTAPQTHPPYPI